MIRKAHLANQVEELAEQSTTLWRHIGINLLKVYLLQRRGDTEWLDFLNMHKDNRVIFGFHQVSEQVPIILEGLEQHVFIHQIGFSIHRVDTGQTLQGMWEQLTTKKTSRWGDR